MSDTVKVNRGAAEEKLSLGALAKKILFTELIGGMGITLKYQVQKIVTLQYPDKETWIPYERFRGLHTLNRNEEGQELCVACELCSRICPTDCITVIPMEDDTGKGITDRIAKVWTVDLVRCLYCGYCEEACPTTAVRMGRHFETAVIDKKDALKTKDQLLVPEPIPESMQGGRVVKARFSRKGGAIKVTPDLSGKSWKRNP